MGAKEKFIEKAQGFAMKGNLDKAIAEYKSALDLDNKDISIRLKIGDLYIKIGNKDEAINQYKEVAKAHSQKGFYLKAIAVYKQILKVDETNFEMHYKLAELYAKQKLISDAIAEYTIIVNLFEKKGKTGEVMQLLKEMLDIDVDNIPIRIKLAQYYQKQKFDKDALELYAVIFDKYIAQGLIDKAEKLYTALLQNYPNHPVLLKGLAVISVKRGDAPKFLKFAKPLLAVYKQSGDAENGKTISEAILNIKPDDADALAYLGRSAVSTPEPPRKVEKEEPMLEAVQLEDHEEVSALIEAPEELHEELHEEIHEEPAEEAKPGESLIEFPVEEAGEAKPDESLIEFPAEETGESKTDDSLIEFPVETGGEAKPEESLIEFPAEESGGAKTEESLIEFPSEEAGETKTEESLIEFPVETGGETKTEESLIEFPAEEAGEAKSEESLIEFPVETGGESAPEESLIEFPADTGEETKPEDASFEVEVKSEPARAEAIKPAKKSAAPPVSQSEIDSAFSTAESDLEASARPSSGKPAKEEEQHPPKVSHEDLSKALTDIMDNVTADDKISDKLVEEEIEIAPAKEKKEEFVDISSEMGLEDSFKDLAGEWGSAKTSAAEKPKAAEEIVEAKEDYETHLNLGIAYMEMEMHTEAVKELNTALKEPRLAFDAHNRLAMCYMRVNNFEEAIHSYTKALKVEGRNDEERKAVMYELALAYESAGKRDDAGKLYTAINSIDPEYREVAKKVKKLVSDGPKIPLDDNLIEVEML